jgi:hypothetical protein
MLNLPNGKITPAQILMPVGILSLVVFVFLGFQFVEILHDRQNMHQAMEQQQQPLTDALKVQQQLNALAIGTQKLADKGDKDAEAIIQRMNKLGIKVNANAPGLPPGPPAPRAPIGAAPKAPPPAAAPETPPG